MWSNYLKIAVRNLRRQKGYAGVNLLGLALGLACALLIFTYVRFELSFDRFHEHSDRIYRVLKDANLFGERRVNATTSAPTGPAMVRDLPEVMGATRMHMSGPEMFWHDGRVYTGLRGRYADSSFFEVFSFTLQEGDPATALQGPNSVVLTRSAADQIFGAKHPIGETISAPIGGFGQREMFTVTGIAEDPPTNSHLDFDVLVSFASFPSGTSLGAFQFNTYVLLQEDIRPASLETKLASFAQTLHGQRYTEEQFEERNFQYKLQPLTGIYLSSTGVAPRQGSWLYIYLFTAIGVVILMLAGANYINLATARAARRRREVGVRKVLGAARKQVAAQFLSEGILLSVCALPIALGLLSVGYPLFQQVTGQEIPFGWTARPEFMLGALGMTLLLGVAAGSYPALYLSGFQPVRALGSARDSSAGPALLRKGLIVFQFVISIGLIAAAIGIWRQVNYMQTKDLGFRPENILVVDARTEEGLDAIERVRNRFRRAPGVASASATGWLPALKTSRPQTARPAGRKEVEVRPAYVDTATIQTLGIELIAGKGFSAGARQGTVLNRAAAEAFGWLPAEALGKQVYLGGMFRPVLGVTENFHHAPLRQEIEPLAFYTQPKRPEHTIYGEVLARLRPEASRKTLVELTESWRDLVPGAPFSYYFLDQKIGQIYGREARLGRIFTVFAGLAVFLACLGLVGLAAYAAGRRAREIAIRKVVGATTEQIVGLLSKEFAILLAIGFLIAAPLASYGLQRWLEHFAYRIDPRIGTLLLTGGIVAVLAFGAIGWQTLKAALTNPADSLRYE